MAKINNHAAASALQQQARTAVQPARAAQPTQPVQPVKPAAAAKPSNDGELDLLNWDYDAAKFFGFDRKTNG